MVEVVCDVLDVFFFEEVVGGEVDEGVAKGVGVWAGAGVGVEGVEVWEGEVVAVPGDESSVEEGGGDFLLSGGVVEGVGG